MMIGVFFKRLAADRQGTMTIETAIVAPVLVVLALGIFEVGSVVARQHELQSSANEAAMIVLAANQGPKVELSEMKSIIRKSVDLADQEITLTREYRCALANGRVKDKGNCPTTGVVSSYVVITVNDTYTPTWTAFGVGKDINFKINRSVLVG